jgi:hypothetical protein
MNPPAAPDSGNVGPLEDPKAGFVTVPELARLLGVSERTAYRRALKLTEGSDRVTEGGRVFVRQSALGVTEHHETLTEPSTRETRAAAARVTETEDQSSVNLTESDGSRDGKNRPGDGTFPEPDGSPSVTPEDPRDALIEQLRAENARTWAALDKSQQLQLAALGEAAAMRARVEALEKQNRALIEGKEPATARNTVSDAQEAILRPEGAGDDKSATGQVSRPWWRFWG